MLRERWKCAVIGAAICGIAGPAIAVILLNVYLTGLPSIRAVARTIPFEEWAVATVGFGPPALFLGAIGAVLLQKAVQHGDSVKITLLQTVVLGLILGSVVAVIAEAVLAAIFPGQGNFKSEALLALPLASATGSICGLLVLWVFHLTNVLSHRNPPAKQ